MLLPLPRLLSIFALIALTLPALAAPALAGGYAIALDGTLYSIDCGSARATPLGVVRAGGGAPLVLTDLGTAPAGAIYGLSETSLYR
ncbi:hypothetical protein OVW19_27805, partial [Klebsiella pneumoniae]|uniref:hypothetical protein n=1 Tax=Klebsiella pneumoniae TaxID=573 RepID=UPI00226F3DD7